jgi:hypothetical protein
MGKWLQVSAPERLTLSSNIFYFSGDKAGFPKLTSPVRVDCWFQPSIGSCRTALSRVRRPCRSTHGSVALRAVAASLHKPVKWPELKSFTVIENQRVVNKKRAGKALVHQQPKSKCATDWCYESRSPAVEESPALVHEYCFQRQPDACTLQPPPQNLATLEHVTLNLIRMVPVKRKDGIKARRMIIATGNNYCAELFGLA